MMTVDQYIKRHLELKRKKDPWLRIFQTVGEYVHQRKTDFTNSFQPGEFLNETLFDSTAVKANRKMAAALIGMLWPNGGRSMRLNPVRGLKSSDAVKRYFDAINEIMISALDDAEAGLPLALEEYMNDQGSFGTSGIACFKGKDGVSDLMFKALGVDEICIDEGSSGRVNTVYREIEFTVTQLIEEYGEANVSSRAREMFKGNKYDEKVKVLHIIEPRTYNPKKSGAQAMPFKSLHIEIQTKKILKESGFEEMPAMIARFFKKRGEIYGRSPAMDAMPDILELNATKEARISAIEKKLDPPLGIADDGTLGSNSIDTSAGAINVVKVSGRAGTSNPIFPLYAVGDIREADKSIEELKASIDDHFNIDKLLDFNNETQMTLGEAQIRDKIRGQALGSLFSRQISECFTPLIERAVSVMFRNGKLGYFSDSREAQIAQQIGDDSILIIPDEVAKLIRTGHEFYEVKYFTPAARLMMAEEQSGIMAAWGFAGQLAQLDSGVLDILDADQSLRIVTQGGGAPSSILRSDEMVEKIRQQKQAQAEQAAQMQQAQQGLEMAGQAAQVDQAMAGAEQGA